MKSFKQPLVSWSAIVVALVLFAVVVGVSNAITETASAASVVGLRVDTAAVASDDATNVFVSLEENDDDSGKEQDANDGVVVISATQSGRGVISDIAKLKKIGEILETVGETVIPALVESQTQKSLLSAVTGDAQVKQPFGLKLIHALKQQEGFGEEINASMVPV